MVLCRGAVVVKVSRREEERRDRVVPAVEPELTLSGDAIESENAKKLESIAQEHGATCISIWHLFPIFDMRMRRMEDPFL